MSGVYSLRWWDYRRMAPGHSFYYFAHCYYRATKTAAKRMVSERTAHRGTRDVKSIHALYGASLVDQTAERIWDRDPAHITGIWKAMLVADALGIPYPEYCRLACQVAIDRQWQRLPRPSQLYSENLAVYIMDAWDDLRKGKLVVAKHPIYDIEHYDGRPMQEAYRTYLIEQISQIEGKATALANVLYFRPQLPLDLAEQHFPKQLIDRARNLAN